MGATERADRRGGVGPLAWILLASPLLCILMLLFLVSRSTIVAPTLRQTGLR